MVVGGRFVVVCFVCWHVGSFSRCCCLCVGLWEVDLVRLCLLGVEDVGGLRYEVLVLLGAFGAKM